MKEKLITKKDSLPIVMNIISILYQNGIKFNARFGNYSVEMFCENFDIIIFRFATLRETEIILADVPDFFKEHIKTLL